MKVQKIKCSFEDWEEHINKAPSKVIQRIMVNLKPVSIINSILYIEYVGPKDKATVFNEYFKKERINVENYLAPIYGTNRVLNGKELDQEKLNWLENLVNNFQPKNINFNIYKKERD